MKSTNTILTVLALFLAFSLSYGQTVEKTLVKAFNLQGKQIVELDLDGQVELSKWDNDIMRIQMNIAMNGNSLMLKSFVRAGRYHLFSKTEADRFVVFAPGMKKKLNLEEIITYKVFVPSDVIVKFKDEIISSNQSIRKDASSL